MDVKRRFRERAEGGFSLIEVILAIGLLAGVLISIASMFILGSRQVKSGKTMTEANVLAQDIMEEFENRSYTFLYTDMGAADTDTSVTVRSDIPGSPIESWQAEIDRNLGNGYAQVNLVPVGPGTPDFGTGTGIRLRVDVNWNELGRPRTVSMSTTRF